MVPVRTRGREWVVAQDLGHMNSAGITEQARRIGGAILGH